MATSKSILLLFLISASPCGLEAADQVQVLDHNNRYHLGTAGVPEWDSFEGKTPHGPRLDLRFSAKANDREATIFLFQDDVKLDWRVELNGKRIGSLFLMEAPLVLALPIPAGTLRDGENVLAIVPPKAIDDILVGGMMLDRRPLKEAVAQATLDLLVTDSEFRAPLPCRITITDETGAFSPLVATGDDPLAVRPGVVYTPNGAARIGVPTGRYTIYATRGFEYGLAAETVSIQAGENRRLELHLRREVPTPGLVSCDTHTHTVTHSRHGDATIEERVITLAGEAVELPIATDHEFLADYAPAAQKTGAAKYFTPVIGCETTTAKGHFNSFPIAAGSRVPDLRILDWPLLMQAIRSTPGVRVVVLNHPRNVHNNFQPFASTNFNAVTGENKRGFEFGFDAIEVANSSALQSDLMLGFHDWFALLNHGYRVTAVGSSDGHDVSRFIVGQGRSYVSCDDRDPSKIDVEAACESFLRGRVLVSLGLLAQMTVDRKFKVGDLATGVGDQIRVEVAVLGPSWVEADLVELFANGVKIREQKIGGRSRPGAKPAQGHDGTIANVTWSIPKPGHDVHLVALASGPGVAAPYWAIARPYQPSSRSWKPRVLGATNPIWIDADGDGKFSAARVYAQTLLQTQGTNTAKPLPALRLYDEAVAGQAASLLHRAGVDVRDSRFILQLRKAAPRTQDGFDSYLRSLAQP